MDFNHTEDRRMLSDSLRKYLADRYPIETRSETAYEPPFHSAQHWNELVELGVLSAFLTEEEGGFGGAGFDITVVFEELGRALCAEPMLAALMGLRLLAELGELELAGAIAAGEKKVAVAVFEPDNYDTLDNLQTRAKKAGDAWQLSGRKSAVYGAPMADVILVVAVTESGLGVFATEAAEVLPYAMIDGGGAAEVIMNDTAADCLSEDAHGAIEQMLDAGRLALCAEAVGAMESQLAMTIDYLKQRQQFGRPIATFQALQHRVIDMAIEVEQSRSITTLAAGKFESDERARHVAMAKNLIGRAGHMIAEEATQLHGGIGMTWEYAGSHYTKRLVMIDHQLGDRYHHVGQVAQDAA